MGISRIAPPNPCKVYSVAFKAEVVIATQMSVVVMVLRKRDNNDGNSRRKKEENCCRVLRNKCSAIAELTNHKSIVTLKQ